jgi:hypothetical protein
MFVNKYAYNNLHYSVTHSPFELRPFIGSHGYKLPEGASAHEFTLRTFTYNTPREGKWTTNVRLDERQAGAAFAGGNGVYSLRLPPESKVQLVTTVTPPDIRIPSVDVKVPADANGRDRFVTVPVVPGGIVTTYAQGSVSLRRQKEGAFRYPATANGVQVPKEMAGDEYLLGREYAAASRVGALSGSWDKFQKTKFPLNSIRSVRVPPDVREMYLAINDSPKGFAEHSGDGFTVQVVATPLEPYFTQTDSAVSLEAMKTAKLLENGANLPTWLMCGERATGKKIKLHGTVMDLVESTPCFAYVVRKIGQ